MQAAPKPAREPHAKGSPTGDQGEKSRFENGIRRKADEARRNSGVNGKRESFRPGRRLNWVVTPAVGPLRSGSLFRFTGTGKVKRVAAESPEKCCRKRIPTI